MIDGRAREMSLGPITDISLAEARDLANRARAMVRDRVDPIEAKRAIYAKRRIEAARHVTFAECANRYLDTKTEGFKNDKHRKQWRSTLEAYAFPSLGNLPVGEIDTPLIIKTLAPLWERVPETASRLRGRIEKVLAWATVQELRAGDNPARWKNHLDQIFQRSKAKNHQALAYADLPAFMEKLRAKDGVSARALEFAILTAARTGEVIGAKWDEIDLKAKTWTVPAERMKAGQEHVVPLGRRAVEILRTILGGKSGTMGHIFINGGGKPLSNMAMLELLRGMVGNGYTVHGFRSTFRDWAGDESGHEHETIEFALAHEIPNKASGAYRRYRAVDKRAALMRDWERYCGEAKVY